MTHPRRLPPGRSHRRRLPRGSWVCRRPPLLAVVTDQNDSRSPGDESGRGFRGFPFGVRTPSILAFMRSSRKVVRYHEPQGNAHWESDLAALDGAPLAGTSILRCAARDTGRDRPVANQPDIRRGPRSLERRLAIYGSSFLICACVPNARLLDDRDFAAMASRLAPLNPRNYDITVCRVYHLGDEALLFDAADGQAVMRGRRLRTGSADRPVEFVSWLSEKGLMIRYARNAPESGMLWAFNVGSRILQRPRVYYHCGPWLYEGDVDKYIVNDIAPHDHPPHLHGGPWRHCERGGDIAEAWTADDRCAHPEGRLVFPSTE
jgi:hypothetical protein